MINLNTDWQINGSTEELKDEKCPVVNLVERKKKEPEPVYSMDIYVKDAYESTKGH